MRGPETYRSARREAWRADPRSISWPIFNMYFRGGFNVAPEKRTHYAGQEGRSKYMPHQGKREMARRSAKMDALIEGRTASILNAAAEYVGAA